MSDAERDEAVERAYRAHCKNIGYALHLETYADLFRAGYAAGEAADRERATYIPACDCDAEPTTDVRCSACGVSVIRSGNR